MYSERKDAKMKNRVGNSVALLKFLLCLQFSLKLCLTFCKSHIVFFRTLEPVMWLEEAVLQCKTG